MKNIKYLLTFLSLALVFSSCDEENYEFGDLVAPTNLKISYEIVGVDASNPNGDGSGVVNFTSTSDNEITYKYDFGDNTDNKVSSSGVISHQFSLTGLNTYSVTVIASGVGGISTTKTVNIDVFSSFEDVAAKNFLSGGAGNSKKWYWAADKISNIGLGPNSVQADGTHTYPAWFFNTSPWWADKLCMYDAEFVFTQSANGENLTFEQLKQIAYVPGDYAASIGIAGNTCHGLSVAPSLTGVKTVSFSPSNSIATLTAKDPTYRGTTMNISDDGFMCWYVGKTSSTLEIIQITDSTLKVRIEEGPRAWYCFFQTEKPKQ